MADVALFPVFLKAKGRRCLVVGGGGIAEEKIRGLMNVEMDVTVVAPSVTPTIATWTQEQKLRWACRDFQEADVKKKFMVIAATNNLTLNARVHRAATDCGALCNSVDDPEHCDFYYPAVVRRGALRIAISTGGKSPALARRLREELEQRYSAEYETWVDELGLIRQDLMARRMHPEFRRWLLYECVDDAAFQQFLHRHRERER